MLYNVDMITKVKNYIGQFHMLDSTDHVVVGLSGGADSVCLLVLLNRLKEEYGYELSAVHIHHGLQGKGGSV